MSKAGNEFAGKLRVRRVHVSRDGYTNGRTILASAHGPGGTYRGTGGPIFEIFDHETGGDLIAFEVRAASRNAAIDQARERFPAAHFYGRKRGPIPCAGAELLRKVEISGPPRYGCSAGDRYVLSVYDCAHLGATPYAAPSIGVRRLGYVLRNDAGETFAATDAIDASQGALSRLSFDGDETTRAMVRRAWSQAGLEVDGEAPSTWTDLDTCDECGGGSIVCGPKGYQACPECSGGAK